MPLFSFRRARYRLRRVLARIAIPLLVIAFAVMVGQVFGRETGHADSPDIAGDPMLVGSASVIDADTIEIHGQRIRFNAIDAPEGGQHCRNAVGALVRCGATAANALDAFIAHNPVSCVVEGTDRYGRALAGCSVRGTDIQDWLVRNGYALAYRQYSTASVAAEQAARTAQAGVWAGEFIAPWEWRRGLRMPGEKPTKAMLEGRVAAR